VALVRRPLSTGTADTAEARPRDAPCAFPQGIESLALCFNHRLPLVRCPAWAAMGVEARDASLVAVVAGGGPAGRDASADAGDG